MADDIECSCGEPRRVAPEGFTARHRTDGPCYVREHDERFVAVWEVIKGWDISRPANQGRYAAATGDDVCEILEASEPGAVSGDPTRWLHDGGTVSEAVARDAFMVGGREVYVIRDNSSRWRKKPVEVDAWQVTYEDRFAVAAWCDGRVSGAGVVIPTLEGDMFATSGDWVIRGVRGEFYPCKPDIFAATYEPAPDGGDASDTYRWDWFDKHDSYGVRRGSEIVHLTSRTGQGYERAVADAAELNAWKKGDDCG